MNTRSNDIEVRPGEFPFRLTRGAKESPFLTWLRNHSNYMAVRGFLDYLRMAAVLLRGIFINNLVVLPTLLMIALVFSLVYGGLLTDWDDQVNQPARKTREASKEEKKCNEQEKEAKAGKNSEEAKKTPQDLREAKHEEKAPQEARDRLTNAGEAKETLDRGDLFFTKKAHFCTAGWVKWTQDRLGLTPPFVLTPLALALAAAWVLLFPVVTMFTRIVGHNKSLVTGTDSSVKLRDRYECSFATALLVVLAVALFELLPLIVYFFHQFRSTQLGGRLPWKEYLGAAIAVLAFLGGAPKLLSVLSGVWHKLAMAFIALLGLLALLLVIVLVSEFLLYASMPLVIKPAPALDSDLIGYFMAYVGIPPQYRNLVILGIPLLLTPVMFALGIAFAIVIGLFKRTFSGWEFGRLFALFIGMIAAHIALIVIISVVYFLFWLLYRANPGAVPDILLAVQGSREEYRLAEYGDLAAYIVLASALEIWLFGWLTVDINLTSIHGLYRDRLASAYLLGLDARGQVDIEQDVPLGELCCHATGSIAPYHLINVALNLQGSKDISLRDRKSDFFIFSKKFIGGDRTGYCRSATMEQVFPQIDLASAMAISAAAASPNMGRGTSAALVAFMTLINMRLGVWIPNPGLIEEANAGRKTKQSNEAENGKKPGFAFEEVFLDELVSMQKRWEQLGDKGSRRRRAECAEPTPALGLAGIAFSGGGIRSATINLGIAQALHAAGIFGHFDYMSTVSGGGYLGSSISTLMRYRTKPVSERAGEVVVGATGAGEKIVIVTEPRSRETSIYRYSKDAELEVKNGDLVNKPGTRLIRRLGPRLRSEIAGTVKVETLEGGQKIVYITRRGGETREYRYSKFDELSVKPGESIKAGRLLVKGQNSFFNRLRWSVPPRALLREMTMRLDETYRWVNLSDGGHIENLATIELLRRRCKFIVIGDGEADPNLHFNGLATLMRTARIDLGIDIDIRLDELRLDASRNSKEHFAIGRITYPGESEYGYLLYLKSSCTGDEDEVIGEYRHRSPAFPHESTADQFFDEGQFEAYRALGQHIGEKAIEALAPKSPAEKLMFDELAGCFQALWKLEEEKRTGKPAAVFRDNPGPVTSGTRS